MRTAIYGGVIAFCLGLTSCSNSSDFNSGTGSSLSSDASPQQSSANSATIPQSAIRKGSFTLWTYPADPVPGQSYQVNLRVEVYDPSNTYSCRNLSGHLRGTDGYQFSVENACQNHHDFEKQANRGGQNSPSLFTYQFSIPGGSHRIVDVLSIQSRPINASQRFANDYQTIEIEF